MSTLLLSKVRPPQPSVFYFVIDVSYCRTLVHVTLCGAARHYSFGTTYYSCMTIKLIALHMHDQTEAMIHMYHATEQSN